jgi:TFIIF-interacting CTD phosphatase-like protein
MLYTVGRGGESSYISIKTFQTRFEEKHHLVFVKKDPYCYHYEYAGAVYTTNFSKISQAKVVMELLHPKG